MSSDPVESAWRLAERSGTYQFSTNIAQYTDPLPSVRTVGQASKQERFYLQGQTNLRQESMDFRLWQQGGSLQTGDGSLEIRIADGKTFTRHSGQAWQEASGNMTGMFAPGGDFLSYLKGVRNIIEQGTEQHTLPTGEILQTTRYTFDLNGPVLAEHMKGLFEEEMARRGELPPGLSLDTPEMYAKMVGTGELWVTPNGLPLRQILRVQFPDEDQQRIRAIMTTTFSDFAPLPRITTWFQTADLQLSALGRHITTLVATSWSTVLMFVLVALAVLMLIRLRHSRRAQSIAALLICTILIVEPLLQNFKVADIGAARKADAAEQQVRQERQEEHEAQQSRLLEPSIDPQRSPLRAAAEAAQIERIIAGQSAPVAQASTSSIDLDEWDALLTSDDGTDTDGDGLTDAQEELLGTSSDADYGMDTDNDGLSDATEVIGFSHNGQTWYTDPLNNDTNFDGILDGQEIGDDTDGDGLVDSFTYDADGDGLLDAFDRDNDGDGVPDGLDDAPNASTESAAGESLALTINGLETGTPAFVEFQVRPTNADHLWYVDNVLDWPDGDDEGNFTDSDGQTFEDADLLSDNNRASYGDMTLVPLLEIIADEGATQLPYGDKVTLEMEESDGTTFEAVLTMQDGVTLTPADENTGWTYSLGEGDCDDGTTSTVGSVDSSGGSLTSTSMQDLQQQDTDGDGELDRVEYALIATASGEQVACADVPTLVFENGNMIDYDLLSSYSIYVRDGDADGSYKYIYLPLSVQTDSTTNEQVAFGGTMYYQPRTTWESQQVNMLWAVQLLSDDDLSLETIHTYTEEWYLTGLTVREDHGVDLAVLYEDPSEDSDLFYDDALIPVADGLADAFIYDTGMTTEDIATRFDHDLNSGVDPDLNFDIIEAGLNVLQVETSSYDTLYDMSTSVALSDGDDTRSVTQAILEDTFSSYAGQYEGSDQELIPSLLFARKETYRTVDLTSLGLSHSDGSQDVVLTTSTSNGVTSAALTYDMDNAGEAVMGTLSVAPYGYDSSEDTPWSAYDFEDYLDILAERYDVDQIDPTLVDETNDSDTREAMLSLLVMNYTALYQGLSDLTSIDSDSIYGYDTDTIETNTATFSLIREYSKKAYYVIYIVTDSIQNYYMSGSALAVKDAFNSGIKNTVWLYEKLVEYTRSTKDASRVMLTLVFVTIGLIYLAYYLIDTFGSSDSGSSAYTTALAVISAIALVVQIFSLIKKCYTALKIFKTMVTKGLSLTASISKLGQTKSIATAAKATSILTIIMVVVLVVVFVVLVMMNSIEPGSIAYDALLAYTIASVIVLVVLLAIFYIPIIGPIIVAIIAIIDLVLYLFEGTTFTETLTSGITALLYSYGPMVEVGDDGITFGDENVELVDVELGWTAANAVQVTTNVTTSIYHVQGAPLAIDLIDYHTAGNITGVTFKHALSEEANTDETAVEGETYNWSIATNTHETYESQSGEELPLGYEASKTDALALSFEPEAGVNFTPTIYSHYAYALPTIGCWLVGLLDFVQFIECDIEWTSGNGSTLYADGGYVFDILPDTLDGFYSLAARDSGWYLQWDDTFDNLADADGDGLFSVAYNGNDPNDRDWDSDDDGLADSYELDLREDGTSVDTGLLDTDGDGVSDADEITAGSNPSNTDSDNDGLDDGVEIYHRAVADGAYDNYWTGGWMVTIGGTNNLSVLVTSDPTMADTDGDGLSDLTEYELASKGYHPQVENPNPVSIVSTLYDSNGASLDDGEYVAPGDSLQIANIVQNDNVTSFPNNTLQIDYDPDLIGSTTTRNLDLGDGEPATYTEDFSVPTGTSSNSYLVEAMLRAEAETDASTWSLDPNTSSALSLGSNNAQGAAVAGQTDPLQFLVGAQTSSSSTIGGTGDVYAIPYVNGIGSARTVENDSGDESYLRTSDSVSTVCNNSGTCMVAWSDADYCNTLTVNSLIIEDAQDKYGGMELAIHYRTADQDDVDADNYTYFWFDKDLEEGTHTDCYWGSYCDLPRSKSFCGTLGLLVSDVDGDCGDSESDCTETDDDPTFNTADGRSTIAELENMFDAISSSSGNYDVSVGTKDEVWMSVTIPEEHSYAPAAALVSSDGTTTKSRFTLSTSTSEDDYDYNPVVASDGSNFLVIWERVSNGIFINSELIGRHFDASGSALSDEFIISTWQTVAYPSYYSHTPSNPPDSSFQPYRATTYDVEWIGDRYMISYVPDDSYGTDVEFSTVSSGGTSLSSLSESSVGNSYRVLNLDTAYNPDDNQVALITWQDISGNSMDYAHYQIGSINNGSVSWPNGQRIDGSSDVQYPRISYDPVNKGWLYLQQDGGYRSYSAYASDFSSLRESNTAYGSGWTSTNDGMACSLPEAVPQAQFSLDEAAESTSFASDYGSAIATCSGSACPSSGVSGSRSMGGSDVSETWVSFDGNDDYLTVDMGGLSLADGFTLASWIYPTNISTDGYVSIMGYHDSSLATRSPGLWIYNGTRLNGGFGDGTNWNSMNTDDDVLTLNAWNHVAMTFDGTTLALYVNGSVVKSVTWFDGRTPLDLETFNIGKVDSHFTGSIDDVRIYQTALSSTTIEQIASNSQTPICLAAHANTTSATANYVKLTIEEDVPTAASISNSNDVTVNVDGEAPTASITSLDDGDLLAVDTDSSYTVGGTADDGSGSGIASVQAQLNGGSWIDVTGAESWAVDLQSLGTLIEGANTLAVRASDAAGNQGNSTSVSFVIDVTEPTVTLDALADPYRPARSNDGDSTGWILPLSGTVSDANGVSSLTITVEGEDVDQSNQTQEVSISGSAWNISYHLDAIEPTGTYTLIAEGQDTVGNEVSIDLGTINLDATAPIAEVTSVGSDGITTIITDSTTISGMITDTGELAAGVQELEWSLVQAEVVDKLDTIAPERVLDLPMDETNSAYMFPSKDVSGEGNHAFCDNAAGACPTMEQNGRVGEAALAFDGSDDYLTADMGEVSLAEGFTLSAWIYPTDANSSGYAGIMGYNTESLATRVPGLWVYQSTRLNGGFGDGTNWNSWTSNADVLTVNAWNHVAMTFDGVLFLLYANGKEVARTTAFEGRTPLDLNTFTIGKVDTHFTGSIDDVLIYKQALPADVINALIIDADRAWHPTTLAQSGAGVTSTSWSMTIPDKLEGFYQLDLRGMDVRGNRNTSQGTWHAWRGEIDTRAPRTNFSVVTNDTVNSYTCKVTDFNLDLESVVCGDSDTTQYYEQTLDYYTSDWWESMETPPERLIGTTWTGETASAIHSIEACDSYGHCTTETIYDPLLLYVSADTAPDADGVMTDESTYAHSITCNADADACPTATSDGQVNGAWAFDGSNDYLTVDMGGVSLADGFTLASWIYPTDISTDGYVSIMGYHDSSLATRSPGMWIYNGTRLNGGFGDGTNWNSMNTNDDVLTLNAWNHVAMTFDGTTLAHYVNGSVVKSVTWFAGRTPLDLDTFLIGKVGGHFTGSIDEVRVYNESLSASEIADLASSTAASLMQSSPNDVDMSTPSIISPHTGKLVTTSPISVFVRTGFSGDIAEVSLIANDQSVATLKPASDPYQPITMTHQVFNWNPPTDGLYRLQMAQRDVDGVVEESMPITVAVDTQPPAVTITTKVLTGYQQIPAPHPFLVQGDTSDAIGIRSVKVRVNESSWVPARLEGTDWTAPVLALLDPVASIDPQTGQSRIVNLDHQPVTITAHVTDLAGHTTDGEKLIMVDYAPPAGVPITLSYTDAQGQHVPIQAGDTIRTAPVELTIAWDEASDAGGIASYHAGWTDHEKAMPSALTTYAPDATRQHRQTVGEAQVRYAHLILTDRSGNRTVQTVGPVYVDSPLTPDIITENVSSESAPALSQDGKPPRSPSRPNPTMRYDGWQASDCSNTGISRDIAEHARVGSSLHQVQNFYTTWDATGLRMTWEGASWEHEGDLSIYLNTRGGGSTQAIRPGHTPPITPTQQTKNAVYLPLVKIHQTGGSTPADADSEPPAADRAGNVILPFAADYVLEVENIEQVQLHSWNPISQTWKLDQELPDEYAWYEVDGQRTHLYLPFDALGISDPASQTLDLIALASEEESLQLWATMPDRNPLNSPRVTVPKVPRHLLQRNLELLNAYHWETLGNEVCPNRNQIASTNVELAIASEPPTMIYSLLGDNLFGMERSSETGAASTSDVAFLGKYPPLPLGQVVNYTIRYVNTGSTREEGVGLRITSFGSLRLLDGEANSDGKGYVQNLILDHLEPGEQGEVSFPVVLDPALDHHFPRVGLEIALHNKRSREAGNHFLEWYWSDIDVDHSPPTSLNITGPQPAVVRPGKIMVNGTISEKTGIQGITLEQHPAGEDVSTHECPTSTIRGGGWHCPLPLAEHADGTEIGLRVQSTDSTGR
jgi:hypothetical protein